MKDPNSFLLFLRFCLSEDGDVPACVSSINWHDLFEFSKRQSISGIYAHTIINDNKKLEDCQWMGNKPDARDVLEWMKILIFIQKRNKSLNDYCTETTEYFKKAGFNSCILKGQGNTVYYKNPFIRNTGDVDIWLDGDRWTLFKFAKNKFPDAKFKCQHIDFPLWDIPVEIHFYPMYLENFISNRVLKHFFSKEKDAQFNNRIILPNTNSDICIPTPYFNAIYQLTHINVHILIEGIGLRQFIDYYYVLKSLTSDERKKVAALVEKMNLKRLAEGVMFIEKEILGLPDEFLYVTPDTKRGRHLLKEIEIGGNFGKYDTRNKKGEESFWHLQFRKIRRNSHFVIDYPSEELSEPIFRICHFIWRQWYQLKWKFRTQ